MGEDVTDMATTTSQLQAKLLALTGGKVDIMLDANTFKNTTQILREMADAWEYMDDISRASALELMGGKRQANTLSALIQNFDTVEKVIETSAKSAGSALEENERWLDSIAGRLDQFNNALQSMWNNVLDDDLIKFIVQAGTELVKFIDNLGVVKTLVFGIGTYLIQKNFKGDLWGGLFNAQSIDEAKDRLKNLEAEIATLQGKEPSERNNRKITRKQEQADMLGTSITEYNKQSKALKDYQTELVTTGKALDEVNGRIALRKADGKNPYKKDIKMQEKLQAQYDETNKYIAETEVKLKQAETQVLKTGTAGLGAGNKIKAGFISGAKAVGTFAGQLAMSMAHMAMITAAMELLGKVGEAVWQWFDNDVLGDSAEELQEKFIDLKSKLSDAESEVERLTKELDTTNETLAELLAKDTLSFVEQEELERLQTQSAELERQVKLAKELRDNLQASVNEAAINATGAYLNNTSFASETSKSERVEEAGSTGQSIGTVAGYAFGSTVIAAGVSKLGGAIGAAAGTTAGAKIGGAIGTAAGPIGTAIGVVAGGILGKVLGELFAGKDYEEEQTVQEAIDNMPEDRADLKQKRDEAYKKYSKNPENEKLKTAWNEASANLATYDQNMAKHVSQIQQAYNAIEVTEDTDASTRAYKQQLGDIIDQYNMEMGGQGAKEVAINRVFDDGGFENEKTAIDNYVTALKDGDKSAAQSIANLIENNERLRESFSAKNLDPQDAIDYFTKIGEEANYNTPEGKTKEIERAKATMSGLMAGFKSGIIDVDSLFDEDGKILQAKLGEMFKGTSEKTRDELTQLLEGAYNQIADGLSDGEMDSLIERFGLKMELSLLDIKNAALADQNIELFPNLKDEIDGVIDSFNEMSSALHGVVDAMDLLEQARAEEAYSGSISLETMMKLMEQTDDYTKLLEIDEYGAIKLVEGAESSLIDERIEKVKTDAKASLQAAENAYQQAVLAEEDAKLQEQEAEHTHQTVTMTGPSQQWYTGILAELSGWVAYVQSLWNDVTSGNFSGSLERASAAYSNTKANYAQNKYEGKVAAAENSLAEARSNRESATTNRENAEKKLKNAQFLSDYAESYNPDNVKSKVDADTASGGNKTEDEVKDDAFQKEMDYWENRIAANQSKYEQLQNEIDLMEKKGQKADTSFYDKQIQLEKEREGLLEKQKKKAIARLQAIEDAGDEGSEAWWEAANILNDIEGELDGVTASIVDLQDAIAEIDTYKFEEFNTRLDNLTNKLEIIRNLIAPNGEEDWFDDEGNWTDKGVGVLGTYINDLEFFKQGYQKTMDELAKYEPTYEGNEGYYEKIGIHSEQEYYDKTEELISQQYDFAKSISDTEQSIVDMYESNIDAVDEYISTLIDGYNDYIDSVKEALDAERDLYDFKKNVQKQAKDISELERRISSLSGSTNASDIAERRKLEAQLYESRESLNDTYYDHAKQSQQDALDSEREAYEESMTKFVEGLRISLTEATTNMDEFLMGVTSMVMYNADTVLAKYEETNLPLTKELTNPWEEAKKAVGSYSGNALDLMNQWTKEGGFFAQFNTIGTENLKSPWNAGTTAANSFKDSVSTAMSGVVSNIETNVKTASGELSKLYKQIQDTEARAASAKVVVDNSTQNSSTNSSYTPAQTQTKKSMRHTYSTTQQIILGSQSFVDRNTQTIDNTRYYLHSNGFYFAIADLKRVKYDGGRTTGWAIPAYTNGYSYYAKGTIGTKRDEWAITDELGPELKMYATPEGNLSFMAVGSTVVPADLTKDIMQLPDVVDGLINMPKFDSGVNIITNAVNKPEINLSFDALVKAERIDEGTLPEVKRFVQQEINTLVKSMNYAIKGKGGR